MYIEYPMIGKHPASVTVMQAISMAAKTDRHVLITGETGTGKELVANAIQQQSWRKDKTYQKINCADLHPELMRKGLSAPHQELSAKTKDYLPGLLEEASGGTLLLDEIEALPLRSQAKLVRSIDQFDKQAHEDKENQCGKVRLLAVSNVDLKQRVDQGKFRLDLYLRLQALEIHAPALRERKSDIPLLLGYYLGVMAKHYSAPCPALAHETLDKLINYPWPGNIRELRNVCENLVVRRLTGKIRPSQLLVNLDEANDNLFEMQPSLPNNADFNLRNVQSV